MAGAVSRNTLEETILFEQIPSSANYIRVVRNTQQCWQRAWLQARQSSLADSLLPTACNVTRVVCAPISLHKSAQPILLPRARHLQAVSAARTSLLQLYQITPAPRTMSHALSHAQLPPRARHLQAVGAVHQPAAAAPPRDLGPRGAASGLLQVRVCGNCCACTLYLARDLGPRGAASRLLQVSD